MPTEQREAIEGEEIHCSGAPTLEQYYQIQKLVRGQTGHRTLIAFHFMFLIFLVAFTGLGVLLSLDISSAVPVQFPIAISFVISLGLLIREFQISYLTRKHLLQAATESRGVFTEVDWTITNRGIGYQWRSENGESSGMTFWAAFKCFKVTDSFVIFYYDSPDKSYNVLFKNWFASGDWPRFLSLAERSIG